MPAFSILEQYRLQQQKLHKEFDAMIQPSGLRFDKDTRSNRKVYIDGNIPCLAAPPTPLRPSTPTLNRHIKDTRGLKRPTTKKGRGPRAPTRVQPRRRAEENIAVECLPKELPKPKPKKPTKTIKARKRSHEIVDRDVSKEPEDTFTKSKLDKTPEVLVTRPRKRSHEDAEADATMQPENSAKRQKPAETPEADVAAGAAGAVNSVGPAAAVVDTVAVEEPSVVETPVEEPSVIETTEEVTPQTAPSAEEQISAQIPGAPEAARQQSEEGQQAEDSATRDDTKMLPPQATTVVEQVPAQAPTASKAVRQASQESQQTAGSATKKTKGMYGCAWEYEQVGARKTLEDEMAEAAKKAAEGVTGGRSMRARRSPTEKPAQRRAASRSTTGKKRKAEEDEEVEGDFKRSRRDSAALPDVQ